MLRLPRTLLPVLVSALGSPRNLVLEIPAPCQRLSALASRRRPSLRPPDRVSWVALRRLWSGWKNVLVFAQPETVAGTSSMAFPSLPAWPYTAWRKGRATRPSRGCAFTATRRGATCIEG
jgi:hypothetical protein